MAHSLEIVVLLLFTVIGLETLARRLELPSPFILVPAGILLGFVPGFPRLVLDPDMTLYVFLPLLIYAGAALGSWLDFRNQIRPITLLAVGCVLFTTVFVAWAAHALIGMSWGAAFVLGAVVSPPDEVAAISIARRLGVPKAISAILEGEGLVNDAAALTVYRFAAAAVVTHSFSLGKAASMFSMVVAGEIAWGLAVAWVIIRIRRAVKDTSIEVGLSLLTPFAAYLPAERMGGSGVLAVVAAGLYISQAHSHFVPATTRIQVQSVWRIIEFTLDGILFLVTGMQLHSILEPLSRTDHRQLIAWGVGVSVVVIAARVLWVFGLAKFMEACGIPLRKGAAPPNWRRLFIVSWSGMRGAISLAAALSIPLTTSLGQPFPHRDLIIFLTFCVVVATLLAQGLSLPFFIRRLGVAEEGRREEAEAGHREIEARLKAAEASLELLTAHRKGEKYPAALLERLEEQYRERSLQFRAHLEGDHEGAAQRGTHRFDSQIELIETERRVVLELRRGGALDDWSLRRIEQDLDLQEMRLRQGVSEHAVPEAPRHKSP